MKNRQIIEHVIEIVWEYMNLFDVTAAFPSVSHEYLWSALESFQGPRGIINAFKILYSRNIHLVRLSDGVFESITVTSGVNSLS